MDLMWPWVPWPLLVLVGVVLLVAAAWRFPGASLPVAHVERLRSLPRYRALGRRQLVLAALRTAAALVVVLGAVLLIARPVRQVVTEPDRTARDIQLCLDVSGSMDRWNRQVVDGFRRLVADLAGERMGLTIFSGAAVTVFPITDDYEFIMARLDEAEEAFRTTDFSYFVGAETPDKRASQVGDGLVSCVQRFDGDQQGAAGERGRAVVLATDNDPQGRSIFSLDEAAHEAIRNGVVVYGIGTPDLLADPERLSAFRSAAEATGGSLAMLGEETDIEEVVAGIQRLDRARVEQAPQRTRLDDPERAVLLGVVGLVALLAVSLLGRRP
jgi:hypothetical protein